MLLFLDFDGVLHPNGCSDDTLFCRVNLLWQILRACPDVNVVFSTSWREIFSLEEMVAFVTRSGGEDLTNRFIAKIPIFKDVGNFPRRDIEIRGWLDANGHSGSWWLAIDDMPALFNGNHPNLYVVTGDDGLTDTDVSAILGKIQVVLQSTERT